MSSRDGNAARARAGHRKPYDIYAALKHISEAVNRVEDLPALFASIHRIVSRLMPARNFYIALRQTDADGGDSVSFPYFRDEVDPPPPANLPLRRSFTGFVIRSGRPLLADQEVGRRLLAAGKIEKIEGSESAVWLGAPLRIRDQVLGAVVVQSYQRRDAYGEKEKQMLAFVSGQIAVAIELMRYRQKLQELVRQRTDELLQEKRVQEVLYDIAQAVHANPGLRDFLMAVQACIGRLMDARNFFVALHDPLTGMYSIPYFCDEFDRFDYQAHQDLRGSLTDYVRRHGPLRADGKVHRELIRRGEVQGVVGTDSQVWLGVPLRAPGRKQAIGVMAVQSYEDRKRYSRKDLRILVSVSSTVALAIDRLSLVADMFHHFNNAMTGIQGNAEFLQRASERRADQLQRLQRLSEQAPLLEDRICLPQRELADIDRELRRALSDSQVRLAKIQEAIQDASRRINVFLKPMLGGGEPPPAAGGASS